MVALAAVVGLVWAYTDTLLPQYKTQLLWSPVILVLLFGLFSVVTIIYRWQNGLSFYSIERHPTNVFACRVATRPRHHVRQVPADGAPGRAAEVHAAGAGRHHGYLLDLLDTELCQPAQQLYPHNLAGILETAIRGTNTQFEDHVFSLDYKVSGPIGVVFTPDVMTQYLMLFNTLWRAKRMEWVLSCTWKKLASLHKMARQLPELSPVLHLANLVASEMIHFIHQMAYYTTFEVMECGWDSLNKMINTAESLDEIISAHEEFLGTLVARALLDDRSRDILTQLRAIYDRILEFQTIANRIHDEAVEEVSGDIYFSFVFY